MLKAKPSRARSTKKVIKKMTIKKSVFHKASKSKKSTPAPQLVEVLVSFDTTGSMAPALHAVRSGIQSMLRELFKAVPNLRIGLIAHGDYCDKGATYLTKECGLTDDHAKLEAFTRTTGDTGGGDAPEAYEYVLWKAKQFKWTEGSKKVLVMIGDDIPHSKYDKQNTMGLDWRNECKELAAKGIQVYGVQALGNHYAEGFWSEIASITGGYHLELDSFSDVPAMIQAVTRFQQGGKKAVKAYSEHLTTSGLMTRGMSSIIGCLSGVKSIEIDHGSHGSDKFKVLNVPTDIRIDEFVKSNKLAFEPGRGFYQFTKRVEVQGYKEVVVINKATGQIYQNVQARKLIGLPADKTATVSPTDHADYICFIQSTSNNRKLIGGTKFLYEVSK